MFIYIASIYLFANLFATGTPFRINVDATDNGHYVTAYGAGLFQGASGELLHFCVTQGQAVLR